jgi:peptidyl-prolyl cis-trans isomerase A (cyclophilin A)
MKTNHGTITIELYEHRAPKTVANFVGLATGKRTWTDPDTGETRNDPYYDGVIFHRVIPGFMIQGGDRTGTGRGGPGYRFEDEFHPELRHSEAGMLSMANSGPNTNGSQFFITDGATPHLNDGHAVFGKVVSGLDIVKAIANAPRSTPGDRPHDEIVIESLTCVRK